jgi:hypothetical protein
MDTDSMIEAMLKGSSLPIVDFSEQLQQLVEDSVQQFAHSLPGQPINVLSLYQAGIDALRDALDTFGSCHERDFPEYARDKVQAALRQHIVNLTGPLTKNSQKEFLSAIDKYTASLIARCETDLQSSMTLENLSAVPLSERILSPLWGGLLQEAWRNGATEIRLALVGDTTVISYNNGNNWIHLCNLPFYYFRPFRTFVCRGAPCFFGGAILEVVETESTMCIVRTEGQRKDKDKEIEYKNGLK